MNAWIPFEARLAARLESEFASFACALTGAGPDVEHAPTAGGWSPLAIGEHVVLANHFLGLLANKIVDKSLAHRARGHAPPPEPPSLADLDALARREFHWPHPEHMTPTGNVSLATVLARLDEQRAWFASALARVAGGCGALHRIRISVVPGDDRLDFYRLLYFVLLHVARHRAQVERAVGQDLSGPSSSPGRAP